MVRNSCWMWSMWPSTGHGLCIPHFKFRQCLGPSRDAHHRDLLSQPEVSSLHALSASHLILWGQFDYVAPFVGSGQRSSEE